MRRHRDLEVVVAAAAVGAVGALLIPIDLIRLFFALPLALFLPGYALASAARLERQLDRPQLLLTSLGLSLALLAIGGLLPNYLGGLRAGPWALLLFLVTLAAARAAAIRRPRVSGPRARLALPGRPGALATGLVLAGVLLAAAAIALAFVPVSARHAIGYSELWIRPLANGSVRVGVGSGEHDRVSYGLIASFGAGRDTDERRFSLDPGERRAFEFFPRRQGSRPLHVAATLYRASRPGVPYRRVSGWIAPPNRR